MIKFVKNISGMSLLINEKTDEALEYREETEAWDAGYPNDLTIITKQNFVKRSKVSNELKSHLEKKSARLRNIFKQILSNKGEYNIENIEWLDDETVRVKNVSETSIQDFVRYAEALGKDIAYSKQTTIRISNID